MFSDQEEHYRGALWLYNTTQGVVAPGGQYETIDEAEATLAAYADEELAFIRETIDNGITTYAQQAYAGAFNVAVITRVENGDVVSRALLPDGWLPPGDPRRPV